MTTAIEARVIARLTSALKLARERIAGDRETMNKLSEIFVDREGGIPLKAARDVQDRADAATFEIIDGALTLAQAFSDPDVFFDKRGRAYRAGGTFPKNTPQPDFNKRGISVLCLTLKGISSTTVALHKS